MIARRLTDTLREDLGRKMVLLSGPRQCGKTTLVQQLAKEARGLYLSWDNPADRRAIQNRAFDLDLDAPLWAFDELHKFHRWRNFLTGLYDSHRATHQILVTGSARLDLYGRGGDSLQGRYYGHHLHPLTASEIARRGLVSADEVVELPRAPVPDDVLSNLLAY